MISDVTDAAARFDAREKREAERFAKATKVDAESYTGAVYCPGGPRSTSMVEDDDGDSHMHLTLADFFEACGEAGEERTRWCVRCGWCEATCCTCPGGLGAAASEVACG